MWSYRRPQNSNSGFYMGISEPQEQAHYVNLCDECRYATTLCK